LEKGISHFNEDFIDLDVCDVDEILDICLDTFVNSFCIKMLKLILGLTWLIGVFSSFTSFIHFKLY